MYFSAQGDARAAAVEAHPLHNLAAHLLPAPADLPAPELPIVRAPGDKRHRLAIHKPDYITLVAGLESQIAARADVAIESYARVSYDTPSGRREYDLHRIASAGISPGDPILLVRAGIHGDEPAGSLTLMRRLGEIVDFAHARGVKLLIYPMDNPSGYEADTRYNAAGDRGDGGNNDFLRCELEDGTISGDLADGRSPKSGEELRIKRWLWASDPSLNIPLPQETRALHAELRKVPFDQVRAVLDLHQDNYLSRPMAYQYGYGDSSRYRGIVAEAEKACEILRSSSTERHPARPSDYEEEQFKALSDPSLAFEERADENGFILHYDGTLPELFHRSGTPHCVTLETSGMTPSLVADEVHIAWIKGLVEMIRP